MLRGQTVRALLAVLPAVLCLALAPAAAHAQDGAYSVSDVKVDKTAATASAARDAAILEAQRIAYQRLMERLIADGSAPPEVDDGTLSSLISDFAVTDERSSAQRYLATFTVNFRGDQVRQLLSGQGAVYVQAGSRPILVLPVYEADGIRQLWDDPNPWRLAWEASPSDAGLVPMGVPAGDLEDIAIIDADRAAAGEPGAVAEIVARYDAAGALVAVAAPGPQGLKVSVTRFDPGGETQSFVAEYGGAPEVAMAEAIADIRGRAERAWKEANIFDQGVSGFLVATVPLVGLQDWISVRERIQRSGAVRGMRVIALSRNAASIELEYVGDEAQAARTLAQNSLDLRQAPVGALAPWEITLRGRPPAGTATE